ncbi:MAG: hypothetical protein ACREA3_01890 [Nitrosotalea sp.]
MFQVLEHVVDRNNILLFQDLYFVKKRMPVKSTVIEAACTICDKGLDEGVSVTVKKIGQRMRFFCQYHLPKDV